MRTLWLEIKKHRYGSLGFLLVWLAAWLVTGLTWQTEGSGVSQGMNPILFVVHVFFPILPGLLAGWWRRTAAGGFWLGLLSALLFGVVNFVALLACSGLLFLIGAVRPNEGMPVLPALLEGAHLAVIYLALASLLGVAGGLIGSLAANFINKKV